MCFLDSSGESLYVCLHHDKRRRRKITRGDGKGFSEMLDRYGSASGDLPTEPTYYQQLSSRLFNVHFHSEFSSMHIACNL